ncbi:hypothetical protein SUGI_0081510 [Cryptomeria japonica]|uniref:protein CURLY FLAG LEAF 2 n=1 Tax=Cryptomeria japonica TaxID=3369 RepID=UPI002408CFB2|nr:protein CURLY FLAG LEAF 2 [Cryptomeria japonica]GLJ08110.1 hypothetical protein SUGI_0081510 [Cryptomeria japonica]
MARLLKVPKIEKVDDDCAKIYLCDEAKSMEDGIAREIKLSCEPLPKDCEQCLDLKTGELYYIDRSCSKRTNRDPRPILKKVEKYIQHVLISSGCENTEAKYSGSSVSTNSSHTSSDMPILNSFGFKKPVEGIGNLVILKGCRKCLSYILIPREVQKCPACNAFLFTV